MFARFQDIKQGALDGEGAINNVEAALNRVTLASGEQISIMNRQTGEFRDFEDVIEDLATRWDTITELEQANIIKALAGVRQRESFLALMENEEMTLGLLEEARNSDGLAIDRYAIYLEGLEAAQNKAIASSEALWAATIESESIKWFYDMTTTLFDFITTMGGLDDLLVPIIAGFGAWAVASGTLGTALTGLAASIAEVGIASALSGGLVTIVVASIVAIAGAVVIANKELKEFNETAADNWVSSMGEIASSTKDAQKILKEFIKDAKYLEDLTAWQKLWVDESKLLDEGLAKTLELIGEHATSWEEYEEATTKAIEAAGYSVGESGKVYTEAANDSAKLVDGVERLNSTMYLANTVTDSWMDRLDAVGNKTSSVTSATTALADSFQKFIASAYDALDKPTEEQERFMGNMIEMNSMFLSGAMDAETYFGKIGDGFEEINMSGFFGEDQEGAELFITGAVTNAISGIQQLTEEFNDPENTEGLAQYSQGLVEWADMFVDMTSMLESVPGFEHVSDSIGGLMEGMNELSAANEAMVHSQHFLMELENESLQFGTKTFNEKMSLYASSLAQSGQVYTDTMGNVLGSQKEIYAYMVKDAGNAQLLMGQVAEQSGSSIDKMKFSVGQMLVQMGKAISNFDGKISFNVENVGMHTLVPEGSWLANQINGGMGIGIPTFTYAVGGDIGSGISAMGEELMASAGGIQTEYQGNAEPTWDLPEGGSGGWGIEAFGLDGADEEYEELGGTVGSLTNLFENLGSASGKSAKEIKEDVKSIDDLLDMVVKKIKQEANAKKDSLKDELDGYKKIIDLRKDLLKSMKEEDDYQDSLRENQQDLSRVQGEIEEVRLDDSEAGLARLRQLQEEQAEIQAEIDEDASDRAMDLQEEALDNEYENFKSYIGDQISLIDDYLSQPGSIVSDALDLIGAKGENLYGDLINWNSVYGDGIRNTVVSAWEEAYDALAKYGGLAGITGNTGGIPSMNSASTSGMDVRTMNSPATVSNTSSGGMSVGSLMSFNVSGNLDSTVLPDIERIANQVIEKLNDSMRIRGFGQRNANQYSI